MILTIKKFGSRKLVSGVIGLALTLSLLGGVAMPTSAATVEELTAQIASLLATISSLQTQLASMTGGTATSGVSYTFTSNLKMGSTGTDVLNLQKVLNMSADTQVAVSGAGSPGNETSYFGPATKAAVIKFQNKYASDILTPVGLSVGTGYVGASTRTKLNAMSTGSTTTGTTTGTTPVVSVGTGLTVSAAAQPANGLAVESASRLAFTKFTLTAGTDGDVVLNNVTVERQGLSNNAAFSGLVLIDEDGTQLGLAKTLNSNNQATIGEATTIKSGTSRTFTIAGNMAASNDARAGEVAAIALVSVNTSASVMGSLPIVGASHTINATLAIGSATVERGTLDPNTSSTKEVGTTGYTFSAVKLTAGSAEDITVKSIRWNQSGTASSNDLENVKVVVDGTEYATKVSSDGKYYSATFGSGIVIAKGLTKDISIKGDIVSGSARTVIMDIYKDTDIYVTGNTFNYGITGSATQSGTVTDASSLFPASGSPWYDASAVTVGTGSLNVSATNDVPASNIADGASNVSLGSFEFDVRGEAITWSSLALTIATTSGSGTNGGELITNVTLVDGNGSVIAGPQDPSSAGTTVTISDTVTLPVGKNKIYVKGNLNNSWENNDTIIVSFTPSSAISSAIGDISGQTVTPTPSSAVTARTQTVNAGSLTITPASSLVAQNVIDDSSNVTLGRFVLDATNSGEDVKVTTAEVYITTGTNADIDELNSLQLFDVTNGANRALTTGSNINNPSGNTGAADADLSFTIDSGALTVPKDTQMIVELRGSVNASSTPTSTTTFAAGSNGTGTTDWTVTGADTGKTISETFASATGAVLTVVSSGTLTATLDASSPTEMWYASGDEATIGVFKFVAANENMAVTDLGLTITTASSSAADFQYIKLMNGSETIATLTSPAFTSGTQTFTFPTSGTGSFVVPSGDDGAKLTVKAKFSGIGTGYAGTSGNLVKIATSTTATQNKAQGVESGTSANILGSASNSTGARYFKSVPTVARVPLTNTTLSNGTKTLYKFSVTADDAGDIEIYKVSFQVSTTSANADSFILKEVGGNDVNSAVQSAAGIVNVVVASAAYGATQITVPAGQTKTFELRATVTNAGTAGDAVVVQMEGDAAHISAATNGLRADNSGVDGDTNDDFIWSDRSNSSHALTTADWYNGYKVPGLPTTNLDSEVISQ